ncbi:FAD-binding protein [Dietzia lutea]|uniref:FAD-dependent oxidoreductase 2 FAD-binding domain-containing protein n=2 Tax=Dietzia lutea TaxID=546160 RepID=A0A2S1R3Z0_9ACTN|nr:FAD-binding protein [Dietzia lutea]AWH90997.1 hypothetical protein A6035_01025 [Dietzia lutea]
MSETPLGSVTPQPPDAEEVERREAIDIRGSGQALTGRLLRACLQAGVAIRTSVRGRELIVEGGRVTAMVLDTTEGRVRQPVRKGVIMVSGGFEWNEEYRRAFVRGPLSHPVSVPTNSGDALYMSMKAGAMLANMREAWWIPAADLPDGVNSPAGRAGGRMVSLSAARCAMWNGSIIVRAAGTAWAAAER